MRLLQGEFKPGQTVVVDYEKGAITFGTRRAEPAEVG